MSSEEAATSSGVIRILLRGTTHAFKVERYLIIFYLVSDGFYGFLNSLWRDQQGIKPTFALPSSRLIITEPPSGSFFNNLSIFKVQAEQIMLETPSMISFRPVFGLEIHDFSSDSSHASVRVRVWEASSSPFDPFKIFFATSGTTLPVLYHWKLLSYFPSETVDLFK